MAIPVKTVGGAYIWAIVGLVLGVLGAQRYYARRYVSATALTGLFLAGLFILASQMISQYYALFNATMDALSAGGGYDAANLTQHAQPLKNVTLAYALMAASGLWWLVDLFLIPGMVRQFNAEIVSSQN